MRSIFVSVMALATLPACQSTSAFPDGMNEVARATQELERCFRERVPPAEPKDKGKVLAPCVEAARKQIVARLETLEPPPEQAGCYVDSLDGARRAVSSMQDMVRLYRKPSAPTFGALIIAFARTADHGLQALDVSLTACSASPRR